MNQIITNLNQGIGGYLREAMAWYRAAAYPSTQHRDLFVLFGRGRTGSTLLSDMLNGSEEIDCDKEIFNRKVLFPRLFLKLRNRIFRSRVYGFKLLSYQLREILDQEDGHDFLKHLHENQGYKIIYLTRGNLVRQTLSKHYARFRQSWHADAPVKDIQKMTVDIPSFLTELRAGKALEDYELRCLKDLPHFKVNYEENLMLECDRIKLYDRLSYFLGVRFKKPQSRYQKISPQRFSDFVENWEDLKFCLSYTEFANQID